MAIASRPLPDEQTPTEPDSAAGDSSTGAAEREPANSPLDGVEAQLSELVAYASHYLSARRDLAGWRLSQFLLRGASVAGLTLALFAGLVTATIFVLRGVAHGLGAALGDRIWAGELITGLAVLLALAVAQRIVYQQMRRGWRERFEKKYEQNQQRQRAAFGHDAKQTADERGPR